MVKIFVLNPHPGGLKGEEHRLPVLRWLESLGEHQRDELAALLAGLDRSVLAECGILGDWVEEHGGMRSFTGWLAVGLPLPPLWMIGEMWRRTGLPIQECSRILEEATLAEYKRICGGNGEHHRVDPAEDDPEMATVLLRATLETESELAGVDQGMEFWHRYWHMKQRILHERYGVTWRTPVELNPQIIFD
jgi:hypothetical protein